MRTLHCPKHQRAVDGYGISAPVGEPTKAAPLPARQAAVQRDGLITLVKTVALAEQRTGDHPAQHNHVALVLDRSVLVQKAGEHSMEPDVGIHEGLVWCENPGSHGSLPTQRAETHCGVRSLALVSVSQDYLLLPVIPAFTCTFSFLLFSIAILFKA